MMPTDQPSTEGRFVWISDDDYALSDVALALKARRGFASAPADAAEAARDHLDVWWRKTDTGTKDVEPLDEIVEVVLAALGKPGAEQA